MTLETTWKTIELRVNKEWVLTNMKILSRLPKWMKAKKMLAYFKTLLIRI